MKYKKTIITLSIIGALGVGGYASYKTGLIEDTFSEVTIPFNWFILDKNVKSTSSYAVNTNASPQLENYLNTLKPLSESFSNTKTERPKLDDLPLDNQSKKELDTLLDKTYGIPHTYINQAAPVGLFQNKNGWGTIIQFSVIDDTNTVKQYYYSSNIENNKITHLSFINQKDSKSWSMPLSASYDQTNITKATTLVQKLVTEDSLVKNSYQISNRAKSLKEFVKTGHLGEVYAYQYPNQIKMVYYIGTTKNIEKISIIYDSNNNQIISVN